MCSEGVLRHHLLRHIACEIWLDTAVDINLREFGKLRLWLLRKLTALSPEISGFSVSLRAYRHVLPCGHRHGTSHEAGRTGDQHLIARGRGGCPTARQASPLKQPVHCTETGCSGPP